MALALRNLYDGWPYWLSEIWKQVFQKYEESIPGSLRRTILDKCEKIERQLWYLPIYDIRQELRNKYEDFGTKLLSRTETPDWKNVSENLCQMYDENSRKVEARRSLIAWIAWRSEKIMAAWRSEKIMAEPLGSLMQERTVNSVSVEDIYGNKQVYNGVTYTDSVETLMSRIEQKTKIPKRELVLICNGKRLEEKGMLNSYDIDKSTILLFRQKRTDMSPDVRQSLQDDVEPMQFVVHSSQEDGDPNRKIQIKVKTLHGVKHVLRNVTTHDSVVDLKGKIAAKVGCMSEEEVILLYNGNELCDGNILDTYGIASGATINMLPRFSGKGLIESATKFLTDARNVMKYLGKWIPELLVETSRKVTEIELSKIVPAIGENWELLGVALGLDSVQLQHISADNSTMKMKIYSMLTTWLDLNQSSATFKKLYETMKECRYRNTVRFNWEKVKRIFAGV